MDPRRLIYRKGIRIAYEVQGDGPLVLLVHGLGMTSQAWLLAPSRLADRGFHVACIDNRGTGLSEVSYPPYSMREMAADAAHLIRHLGGPAIVAGISLGGMIAQHVAIDHPDQVAGLVLAATTVGNPQGKMPKPHVVQTMLRGLLGHRKSMLALRHFLVHPDSLAADPNLFLDFDRVAVAEGIRWQAILGQISAVGAHTTYRKAKRIRCPVQVLTGDADVIVPTENAFTLARRIPDAELTVLPKAGHAFLLEYPDAIPDAVVRVQARRSSS